jgi:hypothetical protein
MQPRELTKRKIRKEVDRLILANSKANHPHEKTEITKTLLGKLLGGCTTSIRKNMNSWKNELEAHHELYDIKPGHNFISHNYKLANAQNDPIIHEIQATNKKLIESLRKRAFSLLETFQPERNRFVGGTIIGLKLFKNIHQEIMEVTVKGITPGGSKALIKTMRKFKKAPVADQRLFAELVSVTLEWKGATQ